MEKYVPDLIKLLGFVWISVLQIPELLKISKTNFIVLKLLAGGHKKESSIPPEFEFKINKHFPILKLP